MAINDHAADGEVLAAGGTLVIDGSGAETGAIEVTELGATVDAEVRKETDIDNDGTFEVSVTVADPNSSDNPTTGVWHTQDNNLTVSQSQNHRLVVENISGGQGQFYYSGFEVDN